MDFAALLKILRGSRSLRELAKLSGLSNAYLSQMENGHIEDISVSTLKKLMAVYPLNKKDILVSLGLL